VKLKLDPHTREEAYNSRKDAEIAEEGKNRVKGRDYLLPGKDILPQRTQRSQRKTRKMGFKIKTTLLQRKERELKPQKVRGQIFESAVKVGGV